MEFNDFSKLMVKMELNKSSFNPWDNNGFESDLSGDPSKPLIVIDKRNISFDIGYLINKVTNCQVLSIQLYKIEEYQNRNVIFIYDKNVNDVSIVASDLRLLKVLSNIFHYFKVPLIVPLHPFINSYNNNTFYVQLSIPAENSNYISLLYRIIESIKLFVNNIPLIYNDTHKCLYPDCQSTQMLTYPSVCDCHIRHVSNLLNLLDDESVTPVIDRYETNTIDYETLYGLKSWSGFPRSYKKKICLVCGNEVNVNETLIKYLCGTCYTKIDITKFKLDYINGFITHSKVIRNKSLLNDYKRSSTTLYL